MSTCKRVGHLICGDHDGGGEDHPHDRDADVDEERKKHLAGELLDVLPHLLHQQGAIAQNLTR